jgi:hypothetical protein
MLPIVVQPLDQPTHRRALTMKVASDVEILTVESKLGMGTTFTLSLPMSQGPTTNTTLSEVGAPREEVAPF